MSNPRGAQDNQTTTGTTSPSPNLTGDPQDATYTTSPAASEQPPVTADPVGAGTAPGPIATDTDPGTGTAGETDLGAGTGGEYYSPRDVDGDGNVDLIHTRIEGVETITHIDEDGSITLVEQDTDGNGTYETGIAPTATGIRLAEDLDDDGTVDLATHLDPATGAPVRQDVIEDGRITDTRLDTTADGNPDVHLIDSNGDGRFDTALLDTDLDGITNDTLVDTNGDGTFDLRTADTDNDGTQESFDTATDGHLGSIEQFEALIPAEDHYHEQADTYPTETPADQTATDLA
ncbi:hypothetical protein O4328_42170 [Rhodococcus opacus]|uniref:Calcium-binding protein n=1 Tax=Rhodococcus opacus TaxID=37919 RepID=A0AAX3YV96_RHOOP|nr:hypothetical protein [Rhodococcus opacus]MCZ4590156.1 hypothetical protein [Rhodococcus opacus]WLF52192.1 hypothetical protein Q5707_43035 [Rhodococcus opacus]